MKDKLLAWISAHRAMSVVIGAVLALPTISVCHQILSSPSRLREGEEVVLLGKEGPMKSDSVGILAENPREALFVGEWTGGTVLADEGSVWAIDRSVKVRLHGPEVFGYSYRDGAPVERPERYGIKLGPDRLVVKVGRSYVQPLHGEEAGRRLRERD